MRSSSSRRRPAKDAKQESAGSLARFFITLVILTWALRSFLVQPFNIPSGSMLPTLYIGDYLLVAKWPYGYSRYSFPFRFPSFDGRILAAIPKRGDVVVFHHPDENADLIKRVIGLPGDTVSVSNGRLILNGKAVPRQVLPPFQMPVSPNSPCMAVSPEVRAARVGSGAAVCLYPAYLESLPGGPSYTVLDQVDHGPADDFGPIRVPQGRVFLMGDNRDDSLDSRYPVEAGGMGLVPVDRVVGRAELAFWSTDGSASWINPISWFSALRTDRIGTDYHP